MNQRVTHSDSGDTAPRHDAVSGISEDVGLTPHRRFISWAIGATVVSVPLFFTAGIDSFRTPKELLLRGAAMVMLFAITNAVVHGSLPLRINWRHVDVILPLLVLGWVAVATAASTNRFISLGSLMWAAELAVLFFAVRWFAPASSPRALWLALLPACVNALLFILQERHIWKVFHYEYYMSVAGVDQPSPALLGNPNDVGVYIVAPTLTALALTYRHAKLGARVSSLWLYRGVTLVLLGGLLMTRSRTAIVACIVAVVMGLAVSSRRVMPAVLLALLVTGSVLAVPAWRERVVAGVSRAGTNRWDKLLTGRVVAWRVAWQMFIDHPVVGVGPGCFAWQYMPYVSELERRHPDLFTSEYYSEMRVGGRGVMFGEVHNDHLQALAVAGVPGYLLFLAAVVRLGSVSWRARSEGARCIIARELAFPLAASFAILSVAQFPLELTAPMVTVTYIAALLCRWADS